MVGKHTGSVQHEEPKVMVWKLTV